MGITLKTKCYQRISASGISVLVRNSSAPFIIQEPTLSPGCTLAVSTTPLRLAMFSGFYLLVIVRISNGFPARVWHNVLRVVNCALTGSDMILFRSSVRSVNVYG